MIKIFTKHKVRRLVKMSRNSVKERTNGKIISTIIYLVVIIFFVNVFIHLVTDDNKSILGYTARIVVSGSMEPAIEVNSLNIIKLCDINEINKDDIICFNASQDVVHRVIDIVETDTGEKVLHTKGDANENPDSVEITSDMIIGKVVKTFNNLAPFINKYSITPGKIDSLSLTKTLILYGMGIGIVLMVIVSLLHHIIVFTKSIFKIKEFDTKVEQYLKDIDELLVYKEIINDIIEHSVENKADTRFEYLGDRISKVKLLMEMNALHSNILGFKNGIRKSVFTLRLFRTFDTSDNNIHAGSLFDIVNNVKSVDNEVTSENKTDAEVDSDTDTAVEFETLGEKDKTVENVDNTEDSEA